MKKIILVLLVITFFSPLIRANAHTIAKDSSIGAVLHMDPDDDPIVGTPTNFYFEFKDKESKFDISKCDCRVIIRDSSHEVYNQPLSTTSQLTSNFSFTFPTQDIYIVELNGRPLSPEDFKPFNLSYDIRVTRTTNNSTTNVLPVIQWFGSHIVHFVLAIVIFFIACIALIKKYQTNKHSKEQLSQK